MILFKASLFDIPSKLQSYHKHPIIFIYVVLLVLISSAAHSDTFYDCANNFYAGTPPEYLNDTILKDSEALCFNGFATLYSGVSRTPIWSAEYLTRQRLAQADTLARDDSFHSERRLPERMRANLSDYKGSGYDRGHLAPNADMANLDQQYDSFSLANMIPQVPSNNRYVWRNLESVTRNLTQQYGEVYVISGVTFQGNQVEMIGEGVLVPTHIFKAVYIPATGESGVYYAPNDNSERVEVISVDELSKRTDIDIFPAISSYSQAEATVLPLKVSDMDKRDELETYDESETYDDPWWLQLLVAIVDWLVEVLLSK